MSQLISLPIHKCYTYDILFMCAVVSALEGNQSLELANYLIFVKFLISSFRWYLTQMLINTVVRWHRDWASNPLMCWYW